MAADQVAGRLLAAHPGLSLLVAALEQADPGESHRLAELGLAAERRAGADQAEAVRLAGYLTRLTAELDPLAALRRRAEPSRGLAQWHPVAEAPASREE